MKDKVFCINCDHFSILRTCISRRTIERIDGSTYKEELVRNYITGRMQSPFGCEVKNQHGDCEEYERS